MTRSRLRQASSDALLGWFPFLISLLMMPLSIYSSNQIDFDYNPSILRPFLGAALASWGLMFGLSFALKQHASKVAHPLFFVGLFLLISDGVIPLQWGLMDGTEHLHEDTRSIVIQIVLALVLVAGWSRLPKALLTNFALPGVLVLFAWQIVTYLLIVTTEPAGAEAPSEAAPSEKHWLARRPNIYQLVLDGYSSILFSDSAERKQLVDELGGFTFFRKNLSNFVGTNASLPSFLTGQLFKGGSFKEFQLRGKRGGLRKELQEMGYEISVYVPNKSRFWMYDGASYVYTSEEIGTGTRTTGQVLAQLTFVRLAPELLRREALRGVNQLLFGRGAAYDYYKRLSIPLMEKFLSDELERPETGQYVYVHLMLPHAPYVWDADCRLGRTTDFHEQTDCATQVMKDFIAKLKQLGRYENSLIILQSDHGKQGIEGDWVFDSPPPEIWEKVRSHHKWYETEDFFRRLHSLLLIKPPGAATAPLRVSQRVSQLVDISATIYQLLGLPPPANDGHSVFALDEVAEREISIFAGFYDRHSDGDRVRLGHGRNRATLGHIGYHPDRGWSIHADIEATHEGW